MTISSIMTINSRIHTSISRITIPINLTFVFSIFRVAIFIQCIIRIIIVCAIISRIISTTIVVSSSIACCIYSTCDSVINSSVLIEWNVITVSINNLLHSSMRLFVIVWFVSVVFIQTGLHIRHAFIVSIPSFARIIIVTLVVRLVSVFYFLNILIPVLSSVVSLCPFLIIGLIISVAIMTFIAVSSVMLTPGFLCVIPKTLHVIIISIINRMLIIIPINVIIIFNSYFIFLFCILILLLLLLKQMACH